MGAHEGQEATVIKDTRRTERGPEEGQEPKTHRSQAHEPSHVLGAWQPAMPTALTLHTLCWHTVVIGRNTSSWQQIHWNVSSTLLRNF